MRKNWWAVLSLSLASIFYVPLMAGCDAVCGDSDDDFSEALDDDDDFLGLCDEDYGTLFDDEVVDDLDDVDDIDDFDDFFDDWFDDDDN